MTDNHDLREGSRRRLKAAFYVIFGFMFIEAISGYIANSLALLGDAGHMLTDAGALGLSLLAMWFAERPPTKKITFGFYRAEILAAFINGIILVALSVYIVYEAILRVRNPVEVQSTILLIVATLGFLVNIIAGKLLHSHKEHSVNIKSAYLHVLGDLLGSVGAISAGLIIIFTGWYWVDPLISLLIAALIIISSARLLKQTVLILMEGTPERISLKEIEEALCGLPFVSSIHDLHVWSISSGMESLSVHIALKSQCEGSECNSAIEEIRRVLKSRFKISHSTIQIEHPGFKKDWEMIHNSSEPSEAAK